MPTVSPHGEFGKARARPPRCARSLQRAGSACMRSAPGAEATIPPSRSRARSSHGHRGLPHVGSRSTAETRRHRRSRAHARWRPRAPAPAASCSALLPAWRTRRLQSLVASAAANTQQQWPIGNVLKVWLRVCRRASKESATSTKPVPPLLTEVVELASDPISTTLTSSKAIDSTKSLPQPVARNRRERERQQCQQKEKAIDSAGRERARRGTRLRYQVAHPFQH